MIFICIFIAIIGQNFSSGINKYKIYAILELINTRDWSRKKEKKEMLHQPIPSINSNFPLSIPGSINRRGNDLNYQTTRTRGCFGLAIFYRVVSKIARDDRVGTANAHGREPVQLVIETLAASYGYLRASLIRYLMFVARERHRFIHSVGSRGVSLRYAGIKNCHR